MYDTLTQLGAENCHPKFIAVVDGQKQVVADVVDGVVYLTDAGKKFTAGAEPKTSKPRAKKVELPNTLSSVNDDLDLGE